MRPSLRFLGLALFGWAGVRATTLGIIPGAELFRVPETEALVPPVAATQFPPIEPVQPAQPYADVPMGYPGTQPGMGWPYPYPPMPADLPVRVQPIRVPVYYASAPPGYAQSIPALLPTPRPPIYPATPVLDDWPLSRMAAASMPPSRSVAAVPMQSTPAAMLKTRIDRIQLAAWALLRSSEGMTFNVPSLASGGTLGGSQAGARLSYNFNHQIAATLRTTSDVGYRTGEIAGGVRIQPASGIPVWFTLERRQGIGDSSSGRNAFALFAEGGVYQRAMPWRFSLDAYLQGGVVDFKDRRGFIDGGMTLTRPIYRNFSAGLGIWGAAQPDAYRLDAGPRLSMKVRKNVSMHLDWRQRLTGNVMPGSGPALTLAGDF